MQTPLKEISPFQVLKNQSNYNKNTDKPTESRNSAPGARRARCELRFLPQLLPAPKRAPGAGSERALPGPAAAPRGQGEGGGLHNRGGGGCPSQGSAKGRQERERSRRGTRGNASGAAGATAGNASRPRTHSPCGAPVPARTPAAQRAAGSPRRMGDPVPGAGPHPAAPSPRSPPPPPPPDTASPAPQQRARPLGHAPRKKPRTDWAPSAPPLLPPAPQPEPAALLLVRACPAGPCRERCGGTGPGRGSESGSTAPVSAPGQREGPERKFRGTCVACSRFP
ncbi:basic proline-rich protein-like [Melozone crissalis]|uniref:basic proline-rich protein-like n=1 Tax=Melozone crissalis TaxID=40204 RepID=UPI0023DC3B74|nr:basic proline-rich protein-like [Melozone crissalis]